MSGLRWWRKCPIVAQVLLTIFLVIVRGLQFIVCCCKCLYLFGMFFFFLNNILLAHFVGRGARVSYWIRLMLISVLNAILFIVGFLYFMLIAMSICGQFYYFHFYLYISKVIDEGYLKALFSIVTISRCRERGLLLSLDCSTLLLIHTL